METTANGFLDENQLPGGDAADDRRPSLTTQAPARAARNRPRSLVHFRLAASGRL